MEFALGEKCKKKRIQFKAYFEKEFDSFNWKFVDSIEKKIGIRLKWRIWVNRWLWSVISSVLVNGVTYIRVGLS